MPLEQESPTICEACLAASVEEAVPNDPHDFGFGGPGPYRVCHACARRLRAYALRPREWFHLAARHGAGKISLPGDFYSIFSPTLGKAINPKETVEEPERFPAPTLAEIAGDLDSLVDFAMAQPYLSRPDSESEAVILTVAAASASLDQKQALLNALQQRIARSEPNPSIEENSYVLCARCLGPFAADWVRERWEPRHFRDEMFLALADATAACLPFEEGWQRVTDELAVRSPHHVFALAPFRSTRTLDWMETNRINALYGWGTVAALSHFSWPRARAWLDSGKPLAPVALEALDSCYHYSTYPTIWLQPKLEEPAPVAERVAFLKAYAEHIPTRWERNTVKSIIKLMENEAQAADLPGNTSGEPEGRL